MKALTCEMCGSTNLVKKDGVFVCQSCGTQYSVEEAKKMMVEGTVDVKGTVKVDTSDELNNLYEIARRAKDGNDMERAAKYYDMISVKDPQSWEANFYVYYSKLMICKNEEIEVCSNNLNKILDVVFELVHDNVTSPDEQKQIFSELNEKITKAEYQLKKRISDEIQLTANNTIPLYKLSLDFNKLFYNFGDCLEKNFGEDYAEEIVRVWKYAISLDEKDWKSMVWKSNGNIMQGSEISERTKKRINLYNKKILKYQSDYQPKKVQACYVATAVYGSYDCPQVWTLRRYRDYTLANTWYGRSFIRTYYAISPTLVKWFGHTQLFQSIGRNLLDKKVHQLNANGVENTRYYDK